MRRPEQEITDPQEIEKIILQSKVCKLALCHNNQPYIVPLCFGFKDSALYFHSSPQGKKIEMLQKNPNVCFEFEILTQVIKSRQACRWGIKYKSVIGYGQAHLITDSAMKREGFDIIMRQYSDETFEYDDQGLNAAAVIRVDIESATAKQSKI